MEQAFQFGTLHKRKPLFSYSELTLEVYEELMNSKQVLFDDPFDDIICERVMDQFITYLQSNTSGLNDKVQVVIFQQWSEDQQSKQIMNTLLSNIAKYMPSLHTLRYMYITLCTLSRFIYQSIYMMNCLILLRLCTRMQINKLLFERH